MNKYNQNLDKNNANFVPLTPLSFLERAKDIYPNYEALVYENRSYTWSQIYNRCIKFASALEKIGIKEGDTVSVMAFNTPEIFEAHYSVPMTGAVLNTINTRLDAKTVSYILDHAEAKVLIVDRQLHSVINKALENVKSKPLIIDIQDDNADQSLLKKIGDKEYENFLNTGDESYVWKKPKDEWQAISLSYTSGTTGNPKGVVYHHRGSYLMSTGSAVAWNMPNRLNFLTVVPMFHCNGWGYPWTIPMLNGKTICLRAIDIKKIFELIEKHDISHFGGAPIVLNMITGASESERKKLKKKVFVLTAGAPPPSIIFKKMENLGFEVMHVYGLTETYGHILQCAWNDDWNSFDEDKKNEIKARQGVRYPNTEDTKVIDPETMKPVPKDGKTIGEIMIKGNIVMKGYFKDKEATDKAMAHGWFHSGDLAVVHPDGYIKIKDRSKDIIISGGENISSIEIENTLAKHPSVSIAAVVAKPDEKWGEVPCAFIEKVKDQEATEKELIDFCRETLAGFKIPKKIAFCELPKTSTGKIQKFELRKKGQGTKLIFEIDKKQVFASTAGKEFDPTKKTVFLLHGSGLSHIVWSLTEQFLSNKDLNILSLDLPGHGNSDGPCIDSIEKIADWIESVRLFLKTEQVSIVGHSQGCLEALEYGSRFKKNTHKLVFLAGSYRMPVNQDLIDLADSGDKKAVHLMMKWGYEGSRKFIGGNPVEKIINSSREVKEILATDLKACNNYKNGKEASAAIDCPTLLIFGALDKMAPLENGKKFANLIKNSETQIINECGHMIMFEKAFEMREKVAEFLKK